MTVDKKLSLNLVVHAFKLLYLLPHRSEEGLTFSPTYPCHPKCLHAIVPFVQLLVQIALYLSNPFKPSLSTYLPNLNHSPFTLNLCFYFKTFLIYLIYTPDHFMSSLRGTRVMQLVELLPPCQKPCYDPDIVCCLCEASIGLNFWKWHKMTQKWPLSHLIQRRKKRFSIALCWNKQYYTIAFLSNFFHYFIIFQYYIIHWS